MIKLFRHIRRSLVNQDKNGSSISTDASVRYFKYALGEILLVMIGILLALQVNNWNEGRKDRKVEQALYHSLIRNLESDLNDVTDKIKLVKTALEAQDVIMKKTSLEIREEFNIREVNGLLNDLKKCNRSFYPNRGFYNKISVNGQIDLIQSDQLQQKIIELYEQYYQRYLDVDQLIEHQAIFSLETNYFSRLRPLYNGLDWVGLTMEIIEKDYTILQEETQKINRLTNTVWKLMENCKNQIELLLIDLKKVVKIK